MILNTTIEVYSTSENQAVDNRGIPKFTYDLFEVVGGCVQPASFSEASLKAWGISTLGADSKHVFVRGVRPYRQGWLIKDTQTTQRYQIRGVNPWIRHTEMLCEPYQGGDPV